MLNGALTFINDNGQLYKPEANDGYVDYLDENDSEMLAIAIGDDESKNVVEVSVAQDANVQRVVVGPASGIVQDVITLSDTLNEVQLGETGYLLATCIIDGQETYCALTQDGLTVIKGEMVKVNELDQALQLFSSLTAVTANGQIKLNSGQPTGQIANLPKLQIEMSSLNNSYTIKVLHSPAEGGDDGSYQSELHTTGYEPVYWGDQITELFF